MFLRTRGVEFLQQAIKLPHLRPMKDLEPELSARIVHLAASNLTQHQIVSALDPIDVSVPGDRPQCIFQKYLKTPARNIDDGPAQAGRHRGQWRHRHLPVYGNPWFCPSLVHAPSVCPIQIHPIVRDAPETGRKEWRRSRLSRPRTFFDPTGTVIYWATAGDVLMLLTSLRTLLVASCCAPVLFAQSGPMVKIEPHGRARTPLESMEFPHVDLRVDVPLVLIPVHVTTPLGASVTNLDKDNFRLFEDNVEQKITQFASEDAPLSIGLLFDASGSMRNKMKQSSEAAAAFFRTANPEDEFFLIEFNERPRLAIPFTRDSDEIYKRIVHTRPIGRTSLLDAIHMGLLQMKGAKNLRKAIVIFSDGGDNRSRYTESEIKTAMREADVQVYAMGIFEPEDTRKRTPEEEDGPRLLSELADETGGRHYPVHRLQDLPAVCERIANELRNQYLLGYA